MLLALIINFSVPEINNYCLKNKKYSRKLRFPYKYFAGENLTDQEVNDRLRLIYIYLMIGFLMSPPVFSCAAMLVSLPLID